MKNLESIRINVFALYMNNRTSHFKIITVTKTNIKNVENLQIQI